MKVTSITRMTLHMCLAAYLSDDPQRQVVRMAKRYRKHCKIPSTRKSLKHIIHYPRPVWLVWTVYKKDILNKQLPKTK
jgi:hypothetical protein